MYTCHLAQERLRVLPDEITRWRALARAHPLPPPNQYQTAVDLAHSQQKMAQAEEYAEEDQAEDDAVHRQVFRDVTTLHSRLMRDLWWTTHCHTCGDGMHFIHNYVGTYCCKGCWRSVTGCDDAWECSDAACPYCRGDDYEPSLVNAAHIRTYYKMNPMGRAKNGRFRGLWPTADRAWIAKHGWASVEVHHDLPVLTFPMLDAMNRGVQTGGGDVASAGRP